MAEQIKGFTIELDLDSIKVDSGLQDMKSSMRQMNSEMRKNMSAFDYGEKSVEKYGVQLDGLNKKLALQEKATESARKHYEKMVEEHGEGSRQAQNAAATYNHEAAQLNNLERHIGKVTDEMKAFKREQEVQSTSLWKTGDALQNFSTKLGGISESARDVGGKLTKWITLPAMGVITAAGGITAAFGWDRLVGLDSAQAQLKGLGYSTEEVGDISDTVTKAIDGGMTTMAEGTSVAAGAMAAGVEEGKELERYVKLVGDAAVGANRPVADMAQIFNRVQGSGKLMTQELNMIEQSMPGFAQAMADELADGSLEAFREMVTNGEVGSEEFLDVMDDFAGGMAEAYAGSWKGMLANTKAYIGQIGERLLGGVFEQSKESISEFIDLLSSEEVMSWAEEMGQTIGRMFTQIVEHVKNGIQWFTNLSDSQQKMIVKFGAVAVAAGPLLTIFGMVGGVVAKILKPIGSLFKTVARLGGVFKMLGPIFAALTSPVGIVVGIIAGLAAAFVIAYKRSETFRNFLSELGEKLKEIFTGIMEWIQPGIDAVVGFFDSIKQRIMQFWEEEGQQLMEAFRNIADFIMGHMKRLWEDAQEKFGLIKWLITEYVMPVIEFVIKNVWDSIKTIFSGALDVIMGLVKTFSGLFTGDWSKMWEGIKQIFSGAIQILWGAIKNTFIGRIIEATIGFVISFGSHISSMWNKAKSVFTNAIAVVWTWMKNSFIGRIISAIIDFSTDFKSNIRKMWNSVKNKFTEKIDEIKTSIQDSFVGDMITSVTTLKDDFISLAGDMWTGVKEKFDDIVSGAKKLPERIGKGIKSTKEKASDGMKSVGNKMIEWAGKPFNKVVDGVNWVTGKLGVEKKVAKWDYPQYAKGTDGHPGGMAMIGEKGRELVQMPNGRSFISPGSHTMLNLPKGTQVIPNKPTETILRGDMPRYAKGTGGWFESFKETVGNVWSYVKNPGKIVTDLIDKISLAKNMGEIPGAVVKGGFNYVKDKPVEFVKNMFSKAEEENAAGPSGAGAEAWRDHILRAAGQMGESVSKAEVDGIIAQINRESNGSQGIVQSSAVWDVNTAAGNPARGLLQYIPGTFNSYKVKGFDDIYSGYDQLLAFFNNTNWRKDLPYGRRGWGPTGGRKYATGGLVKNAGLYELAEEGWPEWVIPTDPKRRTDAMKLLALASRDIQSKGSNRRPGSLPNVNTENNDSYGEKLLEATLRQNEILMKLLKKDHNVNINMDDLTDRVNEINALDEVGRVF